MPPITPKEAEKSTINNIPESVFEAFNSLIVAGLSGGDKSATFKEKDVVKVLVHMGFKREELYEKNWLDVEPYYRKAGWKVDYDKPGYCETYDATFTFKTK